jgi:uracil phosphoribosyltransferase
MTIMESVHVSKHPIVAHKLSQLREKNQKPKAVRELTRDLSLLLGYEASNDITLTKGQQVSFFFLS